MQYKVARGAMAMIAAQAENGSLDSLGVTREDFKKLTSNLPWLASDRARMTQVFFSMMSSTQDVVGVQRIQLPAEYIAAGIALFVAPVNVHGACVFGSRGAKPAEEMGRMATTEAVTADRLFALVMQLYSSQRQSARALFEKNTTIALDRAMENGAKAEKR